MKRAYCKRYCQQCSIVFRGRDDRDLADWAKKGEKIPIVCDGCGTIEVNKNGRCLTHETHIQFSSKLMKDVKVPPGFLKAADKIVTDPVVVLPNPSPGSGFFCARIPWKKDKTE